MGEEPPQTVSATSDVAPSQNRGITVYANGDPYPVDAETTAGQLKAMVDDASDADRVTYVDPDTKEKDALNDSDRLVDYVPDEAEIKFQPVGRKDLFGTSVRR